MGQEPEMIVEEEVAPEETTADSETEESNEEESPIVSTELQSHQV